MRITMLGGSGSGKTSYMASLYEKLGGMPTDGYSLHPRGIKGETDAQMQARFARMGFVKGSTVSFPGTTSGTTPWSFDLLHDGDFVERFEWIDYRGGVFDFVKGGMSPEDRDANSAFDEIEGLIFSSDAVIVFLDSIYLYHYRNSTKLTWHHTDLTPIHYILDRFSRKFPTRELTVAVILTKADSNLIPIEFKQDNFDLLSKHASKHVKFISTLCRRNYSPWRAGLGATGVIGFGRVTTKLTELNDLLENVQTENIIQKIPESFGVVEPLLFCVENSLRIEQERNVVKMEEDLRYMIEAEERSKSVFLFLDLFASRDPRAIARKLSEQRMQTARKMAIIKDHLEHLGNLASSEILLRKL